MHQILALDIGAKDIKAFAAEVSAEKITVQHHGSAASVYFPEEEGNMPALVGEKIRQARDCALAESAGDGAPLIVAGFSGIDLGSLPAAGSVAVKSGIVTAEDLENVRRAAVITGLPEAAEALHVVGLKYRIDGRTADWTPLGESASLLECECVILAASKKRLGLMKQALAAAGIRPDAVAANIFAVYTACKVQEASFLVLDLGAEMTDFLFCSDNKVAKAGTLSLGGNTLTKTIMQNTKLDFVHAERLKCYFSRLDPELYGQDIVLDCSDGEDAEQNISFDFLYDVIHNGVNLTAELIYKALGQDVSAMGIQCVYLTGGSRTLMGLAKTLEICFGIPVRLLETEGLPEQYRCPENAAGYGLLTYIQGDFAEKTAKMKEKGNFPLVEETEAEQQKSSFVQKIKRLLHF